MIRKRRKTKGGEEKYEEEYKEEYEEEGEQQHPCLLSKGMNFIESVPYPISLSLHLFPLSKSSYICVLFEI